MLPKSSKSINYFLGLLLVLSSLLFFSAFFAKLMHWNYKIPLIIGLIMSLIAWLYVFYDISSNSINNKPFWLLSMFIFPSVAPIIYLIKRSKLIQH